MQIFFTIFTILKFTSFVPGASSLDSNFHISDQKVLILNNNINSNQILKVFLSKQNRPFWFQSTFRTIIENYRQK